MQSLKKAELSINYMAKNMKLAHVQRRYWSQSMNIKNVVKLELNKIYRSLIQIDSSVYSIIIRRKNMQKRFPIQNILMNTNN